MRLWYLFNDDGLNVTLNLTFVTFSGSAVQSTICCVLIAGRELAPLNGGRRVMKQAVWMHHWTEARQEKDSCSPAEHPGRRVISSRWVTRRYSPGDAQAPFWKAQNFNVGSCG